MDTGGHPEDEGGGYRMVPHFEETQKQREKRTPQKWVQCTFCKKWRKVPYHLKDSDLGDRWECRDNIWEPYYASCDVRQALSDEQIDAILESCQETEEQGDANAAIRSRSEYTAHKIRSGRHDDRKVAQDGGPELSDAAEALLSLGDDASNPPPDGSQSKGAECSLVPGRVIWGKVEGHDWWPAKVVRRRSAPSEVGPPPGGPSEVMFYTPVVFFTPNGCPKEVELSMECEEYPIIVCQRACGLMEEDEAEYAWLSSDNIRLFCNGDTSGKKDGSQVEDEQLRKCIIAAQADLAASESQAMNWRDDEDSDGGWCCAADFHRNRHLKHKKANRRKSKRLCEDDGGSDMESGPDEGPELIAYGPFRLAPKITVEQICAWRRPQTREEKAKELEMENEAKAMNLKKLAYLKEALQKGQQPLSQALFDSPEFQERSSELQTAQSMSLLDGGDLVQQEREAVSTLLGLGLLSEIDGEPIRSSLEEPTYFVKYANRSHLHNEWVNESTLTTIAKRKLTPFKRRYGHAPINMFNKDWAKPERIISRRKCRTGPGWELLIKWIDLGYEYCTWESENGTILNTPETVLLYIELWRRQLNAVNKRCKRALTAFHENKACLAGNYKALESNPEWLQSGQLHSHQMEIMNWFRSMWLQDKGGVLVGDIGQGRTAATASFLQCLREEMMCVHPFLVVVPAVAIAKWDGEIDFWSGGRINTVQYQGSAGARATCLDHEIWQHMECMDGRFPCRETRKVPKADVVLVSCELFPVELDNLMEVPWSVAVLDVRTMAKGGLASLASAVAQTKCPHFVIASNLPSSEVELMNTLRLVDGRQIVRIFDISPLPYCREFSFVKGLPESQESMEENEKEELIVEQLQSLVRKHELQVGSPVRPFPQQIYKEILIPLDFKPTQRRQYKESVLNYYKFLKEEDLHRLSTQNAGTLRHLAEELCLICQHPILADDNEDFDTVDVSEMIAQSGKFEALDVLLRELEESNIKVLLLTQSQKTLNLLMRFVSDRFGQGSAECVFPSDTSAVQHSTLQRYLSGSACFLLTTGESCGLGLTLSKVACVIIVESSSRSDDDFVALSRTYQIGTSGELPVFRLFIGGTVEERMLHVIKKPDSLSPSSLSRGNSQDVKLLEQVLIWGTQNLFDNQQELQRHPVLHSAPQKSVACALDKSLCKSLLQAALTSKAHEREGDFGPEVPGIKWKIKTKHDANRDGEAADGTGIALHGHDPRLIAGYWEKLLRKEWMEVQPHEDDRERIKRLAVKRERYDAMDYELEKDGSERDDQADHVPKENMKRKPAQRRKRFAQENELFLATKGQKKQKSTVQRPTSILLSLMEEGPNDENKWTPEALLSSKAHQDVLTQIVMEPNTAEGKAAHEASLRIDMISKELSLPMNVMLMANQVAEILLTMKEDVDSGLFFHDYTILVVVAFAAYVGGFDLGEGCGLKALASKFNQDFDTMEKVFVHVAKLMLEYKQMLIKINDLIRNKGHADEEKKAVARLNGAPSTTTSESVHSLHRDLDSYLRSLSDCIKRAKDKEELDADINRLASEILDQPPGAPIKGYTPKQWFPGPIVSETAPLAKQARMCDLKMYLIEKLDDELTKSIGTNFQSFQESVRDQGVRAMETIRQETLTSRNQVEVKKQQLKQDLNALTAQHLKSPPDAYGHLLAKFTQANHQWQTQQQSMHAQTPLPHAQQTPTVRSPVSVDRAMHPASGGRDVGPVAFPPSRPNLESVNRAAFSVNTQRPIPSVESWVLAVDNSTNTPVPTFHKAPEIGASSERRNLVAKHTHSLPRVMHYTVSPHPFGLNKTARSSFHNVKLPHAGFARPMNEDVPGVQHPFNFSAMNLAQNPSVSFVSSVLPLYQAASQSLPIQLSGSAGILPNVLPNFASVCMLQPCIQTVPPFTLQPVQLSKTDNTHSMIASHLPQSPATSWNPASRIQPCASNETPILIQGLSKSPPTQELPFARADTVQSKWAMFTHHSIAHSPQDMLPIRTKESPSVRAHSIPEPLDLPFADHRGSLRLERTSSIPGGKATITTGTGKPVTPPPVRQNSGSDFVLRTTASGRLQVPQEKQQEVQTSSVPESAHGALPAMHLPGTGGHLDARVLHNIPQQLATQLHHLQNTQLLQCVSPVAMEPTASSQAISLQMPIAPVPVEPVCSQSSASAPAVPLSIVPQLPRQNTAASELSFQMMATNSETPRPIDSLNSNTTARTKDDTERATLTSYRDSSNPPSANVSSFAEHPAETNTPNASIPTSQPSD